MSNTQPSQGIPFALTCIAALGIVYGDIGTSVLYAFKIAIETASINSQVSELQIFGVLSMIVWSLFMVITVKYITFVMKADNHGEGGILALLTLVKPWKNLSEKRGILIALGMFGAALLYGDGMITPAISVLSAIEGLDLVTPIFTPYTQYIAVAVLLVLFSIQYKGTSKIGSFFGPIMFLWFITIGVLGINSIIQTPSILLAFSPHYAIMLFSSNPITGFLIFGAVFLVVTGGEDLYLDMGHLGRRPIQIAWIFLVFPSLILNYAGQAALLLRDPSAISNPFYMLVPSFLLVPLVILSTIATVIASQALISGVFSITKQASQLNILPRVLSVQTSSSGHGQIYISSINWILAFLTISIVLSFKSSDNLAAAYGVGVSTTMMITTCLLAYVTATKWNWKWQYQIPLITTFAIFDLVFVSSNFTKIPEGGWLPLLSGAAVYFIMYVWCKGAEIVEKRLKKLSQPIPAFLCYLEASELTNRIIRTPGLGVFLTKVKEAAPPALLHYLKHSRTINQDLIFLHVNISDVPRIPAKDRITFEKYANGICIVEVTYGFMQSPNIPVIIRTLYERKIIKVDPEDVIYYIGNERVVGDDNCKIMQGIEQNLFAFLSHVSAHPTDYFKIPDDRLVEIGIKITV